MGLPNTQNLCCAHVGTVHTPLHAAPLTSGRALHQQQSLRLLCWICFLLPHLCTVGATKAHMSVGLDPAGTSMTEQGLSDNAPLLLLPSVAQASVKQKHFSCSLPALALLLVTAGAWCPWGSSHPGLLEGPHAAQRCCRCHTGVQGLVAWVNLFLSLFFPLTFPFSSPFPFPFPLPLPSPFLFPSPSPSLFLLLSFFLFSFFPFFFPPLSLPLAWPHSLPASPISQLHSLCSWYPSAEYLMLLIRIHSPPAMPPSPDTLMDTVIGMYRFNNQQQPSPGPDWGLLSLCWQAVMAGKP